MLNTRRNTQCVKSARFSKDQFNALSLNDLSQIGEFYKMLLNFCRKKDSLHSFVEFKTLNWLAMEERLKKYSSLL